ncbi:hypothetical protein E2562_037912 [Oryza meyeriana var. granulata]|uniref:Uncharacterized protein n=1 Tax=Oryza meyeriana var. granulata TaxID=110450 RepID=A0A6G1EU56_9ORYZ|nr:hypothetical protein E2562_037912 [Oryza meyeriana var. granulata]
MEHETQPSYIRTTLRANGEKIVKKTKSTPRERVEKAVKRTKRSDVVDMMASYLEMRKKQSEEEAAALSREREEAKMREEASKRWKNSQMKKRSEFDFRIGTKWVITTLRDPGFFNIVFPMLYELFHSTAPKVVDDIRLVTIAQVHTAASECLLELSKLYRDFPLADRKGVKFTGELAELCESEKSEQAKAFLKQCMAILKDFEDPTGLAMEVD